MLGMELSGIEPLSAMGIDFPIIHRFSFSNPRSRNRLLSRTMGFSSKVLVNSSTRDDELTHPLGFGL